METKGEIMFRLFRVSVSIFPGLTDRPINLIYRISPRPLTSSTGLLSNNELLRLGTVGVLVPIASVLQLLRRQDSSSCPLVQAERERHAVVFIAAMSHVELRLPGRKEKKMFCFV